MKRSFSALITWSLTLPFAALADSATNKLKPPAPGVGATLQDFIDLLIEIIQAVGIPALVVAIIYAGYVLLTAGDNEAEIAKGKRWIIWTLVGAAIILGAKPIADLIFNTADLFSS